MTGVLAVPDLALLVLVGASGSGKSTFAARHFGRYETVSSDVCRGLVSNDETDQAATGPAFDVLHFIAGKRLAAGHLTVVDATNVQPEARKQLVALIGAHRRLVPGRFAPHGARALLIPETGADPGQVRGPERGGLRHLGHHNRHSEHVSLELH